MNAWTRIKPRAHIDNELSYVTLWFHIFLRLFTQRSVGDYNIEWDICQAKQLARDAASFLSNTLHAHLPSIKFCAFHLSLSNAPSILTLYLSSYLSINIVDSKPIWASRLRHSSLPFSDICSKRILSPLFIQPNAQIFFLALTMPDISFSLLHRKYSYLSLSHRRSSFEHSISFFLVHWCIAIITLPCTYSQSNPHRYRTCAPLHFTDRLPDFYPRSVHGTHISPSFSRSACLAANAHNPRSTSLSPAVPWILRVYSLPRLSRLQGPTIGVGSPYSVEGGKNVLSLGEHVLAQAPRPSVPAACPLIPSVCSRLSLADSLPHDSLFTMEAEMT